MNFLQEALELYKLSSLTSAHMLAMNFLLISLAEYFNHHNRCPNALARCAAESIN
jgi:hypothetical protein